MGAVMRCGNLTVGMVQKGPGFQGHGVWEIFFLFYITILTDGFSSTGEHTFGTRAGGHIRIIMQWTVPNIVVHRLAR